MARKPVKAATRNAVAWKILVLDQQLSEIYTLPYCTPPKQKREQELLKKQIRLYARLEPWFKKVCPLNGREAT